MVYEKFECIEQYLEKYAQINPEHTAIIVRDVCTSYSELWKLVSGFANFLRKECGIKRGDRVVVEVSQDLSLVVVYFAVHLCSSMFVPLEKNVAKAKAKEIIKETGARVYIANDKFEVVNCAYLDIKEVIKIATERKNKLWSYGFPRLKDSADIMYTTGTTGKAKGVEITHQTLLATAENYIEGFNLKDGTVMAVPGPLNHVNPLRKLYMTVMSGNTVVILNGLTSLQSFFHALDRYGVNSLCLPPASLRTIWKLSGNKLAEYAHQIDFVEVSTSPVTEADKKLLIEQLPTSRLYNNYGLSECGAMVMYDFCRYRYKGAGCVGRPTVNSQVVIVDDMRREMISSRARPGLIASKGKINMKGYWRLPEKTAEVKANGFIYTNDLGYFDEDGFLYIIGRQNDTINVGGLKVEPTEVEEAVLLFPGILECMCVPVQDAITGNALKLFVVQQQGVKFNEEGLRKYLATHLQQHQLPKYYELIEAIPRNFVGKPDRNALKRR